MNNITTEAPLFLVAMRILLYPLTLMSLLILAIGFCGWQLFVQMVSLLNKDTQ